MLSSWKNSLKKESGRKGFQKINLFTRDNSITKQEFKNANRFLCTLQFKYPADSHRKYFSEYFLRKSAKVYLL